MNRQELSAAYINFVLDNLTVKDLIQIFGELLEDSLSKYTEQELISLIQQKCPELLSVYSGNHA